jgi:hypothetical protein
MLNRPRGTRWIAAMKPLFIPALIGSLASQCGALVQAQAWGWSPQDRAIDKYWRVQIKKARPIAP